MTAMSGSNHPDGRKSCDKARRLQRRLCAAAKQSPKHRDHASNPCGRDVPQEHDSGISLEGCVMLQNEMASASRVREIRMHGLKGGLALSTVNILT